ncbi:acyl-CoA reductase [Clostridium kluyveri]|uniref:Acyl-CoA reductase n=1 Tax=Clostridium kluyveri TaxID=1534 RepID=A0A1L5FB43_CLOKL|nr:acyl-CoA reductase [Clostridium kluyveri]APM40241.1 acyl-CoA reductase [Clostridium kluyveri]
MIDCYSLDGYLYEKEISFNNFSRVNDILKSNLKLLNSMPTQASVLILDEYSKRLSRDKKLLKIQGVSYLSFYFRKSNIEKLIKMSLKDEKYLDEFVSIGNDKYVKAQARGISCHWIAGNVSTLALYSIFQSLIAGNSNLVKVPEKSMALVLRLLKPLDDIQVVYEEKVYHSKDLLKNICLVYFPREDESLNKSMSIMADARIVWGGEEAVDYIASLPKKTTCKDVVFGPKYSFAVFDREVIESDKCFSYMDKLVMDIVLFQQKACSSPQVLFVEKSSISLKDIIGMLKKSFEKIGKRYNDLLDESTCAKIINERGVYSLEPDKDICCSRGLEYTILINDEIVLEEPLGGRCIFVKEIESIFDIENLITRRIQTIGHAISDKGKLFKFSDRVTSFGVNRVVGVGTMNIYDSPWDGNFMINELVTWCSVNI